MSICKTRFFQQNVFYVGIGSAIQFVLLTTIAMFFYPGSSLADENSEGYDFFVNFFSELGITQTWDGRPNPISATLFFIALTLSGVGLALFFVAFKQFFNSSKASHLFSGLGTLLGIWSGICFVGVAFTPANLALEWHGQFVLWAFSAFPLAVLLYIVAIFIEPRYPNRYAIVFIIFAGLLIGYYLLLTQGPSMDTPAGLRIQVGGQKAIVYASIISTLVQSYHALTVTRT